MIPEQEILDMQSDLLAHRGMQPDNSMPMKTLLYLHGRYRKEREEAARKTN